MDIFFKAQGQLTPQSVFVSGRISKSSKFSSMSSLPQSMKGSDQKELRKLGNAVSSIITLWEQSVAMETRVLIRYGPKPIAGYPPTPKMLLVKFGCNRSPGLIDIHV